MSDRRITRKNVREDPSLRRHLEELVKSSRNSTVVRKQIRQSPSLSSSSSTLTAPSPILDIGPPIDDAPSRDVELGANIGIGGSSAIPETTNPLNAKQGSTTPAATSKSDTERQLKMAQATPQQVSLRDAIIVVPDYDGSNISLRTFLEGCFEARAMVTEADESSLVRMIRSKIKGEARTSLAGETFPTLDRLATYLKDLFSPACTVAQLYGELGNGCQREGESVIAFANRMRDVGQRIIETQGTETETPATEAFKTSVKDSLVQAFKQGLRPEIKQRLGTQNTVEAIICEAVRIEKLLESRKALHQGQRTPGLPKKTRRQIVCACDQEKASSGKLACTYCQKLGHSEGQCFKKARELGLAQASLPSAPAKIVCQLCNLAGHDARGCPSISQCQLCKKPGHSARQCPDVTRASVTCQYCLKPGHTADKCYALGRGDNPQPVGSNSNQVVCRYCKSVGHYIDSCLKRKAAALKNEMGPRVESAACGNPDQQKRSVNLTLEEEELLSQLMPQ